ncbi:MAG: hypothetical protein OXT67_01290 [Zetaproteobacteria bacterium]|nr:hypothetical protein [Zetaproteobacteria bacterium]
MKIKALLTIANLWVSAGTALGNESNAHMVEKSRTQVTSSAEEPPLRNTTEVAEIVEETLEEALLANEKRRQLKKAGRTPPQTKQPG